MRYPNTKLLVLLLITFCFSSWSSATLLSQAEKTKVVRIKGEQLKPLLGKNLERYGFFSVKKGRLRTVSHQLDEYTTDGLLWFQKDTFKLDGHPHVIDKNDEIVLLLRDSGSKQKTPSSMNIVAEISIQTSKGKRYFYLVKNPFFRASAQNIFSDEKRGILKTDDYYFEFDPNNMVVWKDFFYKHYERKGISILDTLKIRMSYGIFNNKARLTLTNKNIETKIIEIKKGPISHKIYAKGIIKVAKIPVLKLKLYFNVLPNQVDIFTRFKLPAIAKGILKSPSISMSMDGNDLRDAELVASWAQDLNIVVDGRISSEEKELLSRKVPSRESWIWLGTGKGFDVLAYLDFKEGFERPIALLYEDDREKRNKPERFKGQSPNVGYHINNLPIGTDFFFKATLAVNKDTGNATPVEYAENFLKTLPITVKFY